MLTAMTTRPDFCTSQTPLSNMGTLHGKGHTPGTKKFRSTTLPVKSVKLTCFGSP